MSKPKKNWVVWMASWNYGRRRRLFGMVVRGKTLWVPELVLTRNLRRAREFGRVAARAIYPFQESRIVVLPQGRKPRRDVF